MKGTSIRALAFVGLSVACTAFAPGIFGRDVPVISIGVRPAVALPLGADADLFALGGSVTVDALFHPGSIPVLSPGVRIGYSLAPLKGGAGSLSSLQAGGGIGLTIAPSSRISLSLSGFGGYFVSILDISEGEPGSNPWFSAEASGTVQLLDAFSVSVSAAYRRLIGLYHGIDISIGGTIGIAGRPDQADAAPAIDTPRPLGDTGGLDISRAEFQTLFPVFYKHYNDHQIGTVSIKNTGSVDAEQVKLSFYVRQYMDNPKQANTPDTISAGEEIDVDVFGLFTNDILEITESSKVSAMLEIEYVMNDQLQTTERIETINFHNRNALVWDDDKKAGAFVTAKDPAVLRFAKNVSSFIQDEVNEELDTDLQLAIALHEALDIYGVSYVIDPTTPYTDYSQNAAAVDYLQFPKQTLEFMAGDCDDLSALYAALLESVGIDTAFITIPGHIYVAFKLKMTADEATSTFARPEDLIVRADDSVWVPVEITLRNEGFVRAWREGASEWRRYQSDGAAVLHPMQEAWALYEPVGLPGQPSIVFPDKSEVIASFRNAQIAFINQEIGPRVAQLTKRIERSNGNARDYNRLGVLYARYGFYDQARSNFSRALESTDAYVPALINMGHLHYKAQEWTSASEYYDRAREIAPENPTVLVSVALVADRTNDRDAASDALSELREVSPKLADRYAYLGAQSDSPARASRAGNKGAVPWYDEE